MTKADIVKEIAKNTGIDKVDVLKTVEAFMDAVKDSLAKEENVYLRGFGSFIVKKRAQKTARNISKNTTIIIPEHNIFKSKLRSPSITQHHLGVCAEMECILLNHKSVQFAGARLDLVHENFNWKAERSCVSS